MLERVRTLQRKFLRAVLNLPHNDDTNYFFFQKQSHPQIDDLYKIIL